MFPFHLRCVSVSQSWSVNFGLSQSDAEHFEHFPTEMSHPRFISVIVTSVLRQYSVNMGRCRSVCGNSCVDGAMMRVRVAMHWDAHRTDIRRCGLVCEAITSMLRHGGSDMLTLYKCVIQGLVWSSPFKKNLFITFQPSVAHPYL